MEALTTEFTTQIAAATPNLVTVFGVVIGLVALIALGYFIVKRVRGSIK